MMFYIITIHEAPSTFYLFTVLAPASFMSTEMLCCKGNLLNKH